MITTICLTAFICERGTGIVNPFMSVSNNILDAYLCSGANSSVLFYVSKKFFNQKSCFEKIILYTFLK